MTAEKPKNYPAKSLEPNTSEKHVHIVTETKQNNAHQTPSK